MTMRTAYDYLKDILDAMDEIESFIADMSFETFAEDKKTINAVVRSLEVIGEAVKNIPSEIKKKHPQIPWSEIAGTRDILIHAYLGVNEKVIWKTVRENIPEVKPLFERILKEIE